jgi:shikimate dehydrogenase
LIYKFQNFLNNKIKIKKEEKFSLIIGLNPSVTARSPHLWNKCYNKLKKNNKMYPADVYENNLKNLILSLKEEKNFLGCAVTLPYKEKIIEYLDSLSPEAKEISSVNIIVNNNKKLIGYNTDYYGSLNSLAILFKKKKKKKILVLGCGGAGKACIYSVLNFFNNSQIYLFNRNYKKFNFINKEINNNEINIIYNLNKIYTLKKLDLIMNTTSVGFDNWKIYNKYNKKEYANLSYFTPLSNLKKIKTVSKKNVSEFCSINRKIRSANLIKTINFLFNNFKVSIFDIVFYPLDTNLIKISKILNIKNLNGLNMNLMQAVKGFSLVNKYNNLKKIKHLMLN